MDPVSAVIVVSILAVGLIALFAECCVLVCQSCHRHPQPSRQVSRVFPSLSRADTRECYTTVSWEMLKEFEDFSEDDCCPICIEEFKARPTDLVCLLACNHVFHKNCIDEWIHRNSLCPLCKHDMFSFYLPPSRSTETTIQVADTSAEAS